MIGSGSRAMQESSPSFHPFPTVVPVPTSLHFPEHERLTCPRCESTNTKFCYFNNYNLSQPRHFCKSCKRYWTKGGSLRNMPIGGTTRKPSKKINPSKKPDPGCSGSGPVTESNPGGSDRWNSEVLGVAPS